MRNSQLLLYSIFMVNTQNTQLRYSRNNTDFKGLINNVIALIPVAARFRAWVWGRSLTGISGSNPAESIDACLLWVVCRQVQVCKMGRWLIQKNPTKRGMSEYYLETDVCQAMKKHVTGQMCPVHKVTVNVTYSLWCAISFKVRGRWWNK
jgi:hypothetical protein